MKKLLAMLCMITCIFGLTACGGEEVLSDSMQKKVELAETLAKEVIVPNYTIFMVEGQAEEFLAAYTQDELEFLMEELYSETAASLGLGEMTFDGQGIIGAVNSFSSAAETMGAIISYDEPVSTVKDNEIIVTIPVKGEKKDGYAEVIFSAKKFLSVESAGLNAEMTSNDILVKASLNTLIGMGTVFVVLILIMAIIYMFGIIPKIEKKLADKKAGIKEEPKAAAPAPAAPVAAPVAQNLTDDLELVAVIAAAIAASEGAASTDGFVVRSIRRANRR